MNFEEFQNAIKKNIKEFLPERFKDAEVEIQNVKKANGVCLSGLIIRTKDSNITPTIYLEKMYEEYIEENKDISEVYMNIAELRIRADYKGELPFDLMNYEEVKDRILPRILGKATWNGDLMINRPYTRLNDLLITYVIEISNDESGMSTAPVTYQMLDAWEINENQIFVQAKENMKKCDWMKAEIRTMRNVLIELAGTEIPEGLIPEEDFDMFVISNKRKMFGATVLMQHEVLEKVHSMIGDFVILPSSVHEVIAIKINEYCDLDYLSTMIKDINRDCVETTDRLSDHPYIYRNGELESYE